MTIILKPVARRARLASYGARFLNGWREIRPTLTEHFRIDWLIAIVIAIYLAIFLPLVPRNTDSPQMLAAFVNDEPFLTLALEATQFPPYGNPANFFDSSQPSYKRIPSHWGSLRYGDISYYGGALYQIAAPIYSVLKAVGLPEFPTAPIVLRMVSLLAGLGSLIVIYNIGRLRGLRIAGFLGCLYVICDANFNYYASIVHPDMLQMFFGVLAFVFAARHASIGRLSSLVAFGVLAGLVQGTKVGGPWLVPIGVAILLFGVSAAREAASPADIVGSHLSMLLSRAIWMAASAMMGYFISTPYAFIDPYYFKSLINTLGMVNADHLNQNVTLWTWLGALYQHVGLGSAVAAGLVTVRILWQLSKRAADRTLIIATVLSISQFLWFATVGSLWHQIGYLLVGIALMAVFGFETLILGIRRLSTTIGKALRLPARIANGASAVGIVALGVGSFEGRWFQPAHFAMQEHLSTKSTVRAVGDWAAEQKLSPETVILFDDLAHFDPKLFPRAKMHGGVLTWSAVEVARPDLVVLSSSLYGALWYQRLFETQKFDRWNTQSNNVRLYQDLLAADKPGRTAVPGISLVKTFHSQLHPVVAWPSSQANDRPAEAGASGQFSPPGDWMAWSAQWGPLSDVMLGNVNRVAYLGYMLRALQGSGVDENPPVGPELRVYRLNPPGTPDGRPAGFASATAAGYLVAYAFDGTGNAWACGLPVAALTQCYIGFDFGRGGERQVNAVRVQWVYGAATPKTMRIEFSSDKENWTSAATVAVPDYPTGAPNFRVDTFNLAPHGRHRYWRIVAAEASSAQHGFALNEIAFQD